MGAGRKEASTKAAEAFLAALRLKDGLFPSGGACGARRSEATMSRHSNDDDATVDRIKRAVIATGLSTPVGQGDAVMCDHPVLVRVTEQFAICDGCGLSSSFTALRCTLGAWLCELCWDKERDSYFISENELYAVCLDPAAVDR